MHFALQMLFVWLGLMATALAVWPRRPYLAAAMWVGVYPALLIVLRNHPGPFQVLVGLACWIHIVRSLDAAASNRGLSRGAYLRYVLDPVHVPEQEQPAELPAASEIRRRVARGLVLFGLFVVLIVLGFQVEPWRVHPYLDDVWVTVEVAIGFTGICDLLYAGAYARGHRVPTLHDPGFPLSRSLRELWGLRWNVMFGGSLRRAAFTPLDGRRRLVLGVLATFGLSGLVHGGPAMLASTDRVLCLTIAVAATLFFVIQGLAVLLEGTLPRAIRRGQGGRVLVYAVWALTIPLFPGTAGPCVNLHDRPLNDVTVLHVVPGLADMVGVTARPR